MTFEDFREEWFSETASIVAYTSGSTGSPKRINLDKEFVAASARATNSFFMLGRGSRFHSCVAADFIGGKMMLVRAVIADGVFSSETPSNRPLSNIESSEHIDLLAVVPSQMHHILDMAEDERKKNSPAKLPKIKAIIIGGSSIPLTLRQRIASSDLNCYETYGMTETASHIALRRVEEDSASPFKVIGEARVSLDRRSCLVITYPDHRRIITNDFAELISSQEFRILGRADDVIISGGKKLHPAEVERELCRLSGLECYVSSLADDRWGEKAVAVVRDEKAVITLNESLKLFSLPGWMLPKRIIVCEEIPLTVNGKINRRRLKELLNLKIER